MILRVEISYVVSLIDLFFQLTVSPPEKNECHLKRDPFQLGKRIIIFRKKTAVFSGSVAGLKSDPPGLQDCIIFCLEDSYNLHLPRFLGGKNSPKHQVSLLRRCAGQLEGRQATTRTSRDFGDSGRIYLGNILQHREPKNIYIYIYQNCHFWQKTTQKSVGFF